MDAEGPLRGGARRMTLTEGQRLCITGLSLADPAAASGQPLVRVWAEVGHEVPTIGMLWSEQPITDVPPLDLGDGEFVLRHNSASSSVRLYGYYLGPPNPDGGGEPTTRQFLEDIDTEDLPDDEEEVWEEYEPLTEEDIAERDDSDNSEDDEGEGGDDDEQEEDQPSKVRNSKDDEGEGDEDEEEEEEDQPSKVRNGEAAGESSKKRKSIALVAAPAGIVVPDGMFLGPPRSAAVENTAGFMQIATAESGSQKGKEILVLYRYTRFSRTWNGRRGVEVCRRTKLHWLRFAVPPAGDMASSLAWAGSSLSPLIYPGLFRRQLQDLWSNLAAPATTTTIPRLAARLQVIVDVGILRPADHTAERMEHMRGVLETIMGEPCPEYYHVGMELQLPEPVRREEGEDEDGAPPAKQRKVAEVEECSLCLDPLESGLAAWPGCRHEFHGECVEKTLARSDMCPLCRRKLSDMLVCEAIQHS